VINTNLPPILYNFRDIAFDKLVPNRYIWLPIAFNYPDRGVSWDDLGKIFRGCQRMAKVLNGVEKVPKISTG